MKLVERFWVAVTCLLDFITLSPYHNLGPTTQHPLAIDRTHVADLADGPVFTPPGYDAPVDNFTCDYSAMRGWTTCWSPGENLGCWLTNGTNTLSINTSYEDMTLTPTGITRVYNYTVATDPVDADGLIFKDGILLGGTFPGPWIRACWGDTIQLNVEVASNFTMGATIHAHGLRQWKKMHMDGVPGITQCPIAPEASFQYVWPATQYGSSWYHSHYSLQYADGLQGPLTIHGPSSHDYDIAPEKPMILTDWDHNSAFNGSPLYPCILLGGVGDITKCYPDVIPNATIPGPFTLNVQKGQRYLLRVINTAYDSGFTFSIDDHEFLVVSADFVPITPYPAKSIHVNIGQRYNIIVDANPVNSSDTSFWIRTYSTACGHAICTVKSKRCPNPVGPDYMKTGVIVYDNSTAPTPTSSPWPDALDLTCKDEPLKSIQPVVPWTVPSPSASAIQRTILSNDSFSNRNLRFGIDNAAVGFQPLQVPWGNPTFLGLENSTWSDYAVLLNEDYSGNFSNTTSFTPSWIFIQITGGGSPHPIHLHGHDFAILELIDVNRTSDPLGASIPRRDVVTVPGGGSVTIAFPADNPGAWLMHCHIADHASAGLGLQILEDQKEANVIWDPNNSSALTTASLLCDSWASHCATSPAACQQTDSGI